MRAFIPGMIAIVAMSALAVAQHHDDKIPHELFYQCGTYKENGQPEFHDCGGPVTIPALADNTLPIAPESPHSIGPALRASPAASDHQPPAISPRHRAVRYLRPVHNPGSGENVLVHLQGRPGRCPRHH